MGEALDSVYRAVLEARLYGYGSDELTAVLDRMFDDARRCIDLWASEVNT